MKENKFREKKRRYIIVCFFIFLFCTGLYYTTFCKKNPFIIGEKRSVEALGMEKKKTEEKISVTILGAVKNGGTFSMKKGDTIKDVLFLAGGFTKQADERRMNLKDAIFQEESIYIPVLDEKVETCIGYRNEAVKKEGKDTTQDFNRIVNINKADQKTLCYIPYIGEKKAQAIIKYRQVHGMFTSIEEIKEVDGIGVKTFEEMKAYLTIE